MTLLKITDEMLLLLPLFESMVVTSRPKFFQKLMDCLEIPLTDEDLNWALDEANSDLLDSVLSGPLDQMWGVDQSPNELKLVVPPLVQQRQEAQPTSITIKRGRKKNKQNENVKDLQKNEFQKRLKRQYAGRLNDPNHRNLTKGKRDRVTIDPGIEPICQVETGKGVFGIPHQLQTIFFFQGIHYLVKTNVVEEEVCYGVQADEEEPTCYYETLAQAMTQYALNRCLFDPKKQKLSSFAGPLSLGIGYGTEEKLQKHFGAAYYYELNLEYDSDSLYE